MTEAPPPSSSAPKDPRMPWIFATVVLLVTTLAFGAGVFVLNKQANDAQASYDQLQSSTQAQIAELTSEAEEAKTTAQSSDAAKAKQIEELQAEVAQSQEKLKIGEGALEEGSAELRRLERRLQRANDRYETAKQKSAEKKTNLKLELAAAQAQAALAQECASVLGVGLLKLYQDSPTIVTYQEVNKALKVAAESCEGIVAVQ